jgi:DnaK suppressor protein
MDHAQAHELLKRARTDTEADLARIDQGITPAEGEPTDETAGDAESLTSRETDEALREMLTRRLEAIGSAEERLAEGRYGLSVLSGEPIPDGRLEIEPWAELTVSEQESEPG